MNVLENHLLSVRAQNQKKIKPNCHPTYNEDYEKRIEMVDGTLKKYKVVYYSRKLINRMKNK